MSNCKVTELCDIPAIYLSIVCFRHLLFFLKTLVRSFLKVWQNTVIVVLPLVRLLSIKTFHAEFLQKVYPTMNLERSIFHFGDIRVKMLSSQQYRAWPDCMNVIADLAQHWRLTLSIAETSILQLSFFFICKISSINVVIKYSYKICTFVC